MNKTTKRLLSQVNGSSISLETVKLLIQAEILKLTQHSDYCGLSLCAENEEYILAILSAHFGYYYEMDTDREDYCLKATQVEIWQYYLTVIIPSLKGGN